MNISLNHNSAKKANSVDKLSTLLISLIKEIIILYEPNVYILPNVSWSSDYEVQNAKYSVCTLCCSPYLTSWCDQLKNKLHTSS